MSLNKKCLNLIKLHFLVLVDLIALLLFLPLVHFDRITLEYQVATQIRIVNLGILHRDIQTHILIAIVST